MERLEQIDLRIQELDALIASGSGNSEQLQRRREMLLERKQSLQERLQNGDLNVVPPQINELDMLKRRRDEIQERLNSLNSRISQLEPQQ